MAERHGQAITFQNWDGGEFGIMDAGYAGRMEKQMFTGLNVHRYRTGLLGPRQGVKELSTTSAPTSTTYAFDSQLGGLWIWNGSNFYECDPTAGTPTWSSAYTVNNAPGTPSGPIDSAKGSGGSYNILNVGLTSGTAGIYEVDHASNAVDRRATTPAGTAIGQYGYRFVANNNTSMYFSDASDATTWGATNYNDIGPTAHTYYESFREGLLIGTLGGEFWFVTGVLGASDVVRRLSGGGAPRTNTRAQITGGERVWYFADKTDAPAMFNGATRTEFDYLFGWSGDTDYLFLDSTHEAGFRATALGYLDTDAWMAVTRFSNNCLMRANGIFTYHTFGVNIDPFCAGFGNQVVLHLDGATPKFYWFQPGFFDRPGFTGDDYAQPGDASTTPLNAYFTTPEWWDDEGHELRVQQVVVDYKTWNTGSATNNYFDVTVTALHKWGNAANSTSTTTAGLNAAGTGFSTSGTDGRAVINVGDQGFGNGFQIKIGNLKGTAIKRVTAILSQDYRRP